MPFYGKYRAKVVSVKDPENRGRIKVICPKVTGDGESAWCEPCVPVAYDNGGDFCLPPVGEFVWVEYEEGSLSKPIYTGGLWSTNKAPLSSPLDTRVIEYKGCIITMKDGEMKLKVGANSITITSSGITYSPPPPLISHSH